MEERLHKDEDNIQTNSNKIVKLQDLMHLIQIQTEELKAEAKKLRDEKLEVQVRAAKLETTHENLKWMLPFICVVFTASVFMAYYAGHANGMNEGMKSSQPK
jgi:FtsZ-binding cell division protein ZapB